MKVSKQCVTGTICVFITSWGFVVLCHRHDFLLTIPWNFSKAVIFQNLGKKKQPPKQYSCQLCSSAINRCSTLQVPLTFLLGGATDTYLVKLAAVALNSYLALFALENPVYLKTRLLFPTIPKIPSILCCFAFVILPLSFGKTFIF